MLLDIEAEIKSFYRALPIKYNREVLNGLGIEASTVAFLSMVGLPEVISDGTELKIKVLEQLVEINPPKHANILLFGISEFGQFAIERETSHIYFISEAIEDSQAYFTNTHIAYLLSFCILYNRIHLQQPYSYSNLDSDEWGRLYKQRASELRAAFEELDKEAITKSFLWASRLEEIENGVI